MPFMSEQDAEDRDAAPTARRRDDSAVPTAPAEPTDPVKDEPVAGGEKHANVTQTNG